MASFRACIFALCGLLARECSGTTLSLMSQTDLAFYLLPNKSLDRQKLTDSLTGGRVGSIFNSPSSADQTKVFSLEEWRTLIEEIQTLSIRHQGFPVLFGLDSVHGANYIRNATLFPQQINLASTFNTTAAYLTGSITATETRLAGIHWNFSPILGIATQPSWPRVYETFGEDPHLVGEMGHHYILGAQGTSLADDTSIAVCMKHFIGYSNSRTGMDRSPVWVPENILLQYYAIPFKRAVEAGVATAMECYDELNGKPMVSSKRYLKQLLRDEMGFTGVLVTDYNEIWNLKDWHYSASTYSEAVLAAINDTSIDISMSGLRDDFVEVLSPLLGKDIPAKRITESMNRISELYLKLNLTNYNYMPPIPSDRCAFGCPEFREAALDVARESIVLVENSGLPLSVVNGTVLFVGPSCNSLSDLAGGWTFHWQGPSSDAEFTYGHTVKDYMTTIMTKYGTRVVFEEGCTFASCNTSSLNVIKDYLSAPVSAVIACVGEAPYAEAPGNIDDLELSASQTQLLNFVSSNVQAQTSYINVLIEGRPRILRNVQKLAPNVLVAFLPGPSGGQAIAEVITGIVNPSGRLPITYPSTSKNAPLQYWRKHSQPYNVQWEFGRGLSYTKFEYSNPFTALVDNQNNLSNPFTVRFTVEVTNAGQRSGAVSVLLYATKNYRVITPEVKLLRAFVKVDLEANEQETLTLQFSAASLAAYDEFSCPFIEKGEYGLFVQDMAGNARVGTFNVSRTYNLPSVMCWAPKQQNTSESQPAPAPSRSTAVFIVLCVGFVVASIFGIFVIGGILRLRRYSAKREADPLINRDVFFHSSS